MSWGRAGTPFECSNLALTAWQTESHWTADIDLSCAAADVIGPRHDLVWTRRALEVEHTGPYTLTIESADPTAQVSIFSCDVGCFDGEPTPAIPTASVETGGQAMVFVTAGRHWLQAEHSSGSDAPVRVTLAR
jgi:hypothetical protein